MLWHPALSLFSGLPPAVADIARMTAVGGSRVRNAQSRRMSRTGRRAVDAS